MIEILLDATIRAGTSILFATTGAIIMERSGVINLGIEGLMLIGALAGFATANLTGSLFLGVIAAFIAALAAGAIHGLVTVILRGNQIVSGLSLTLFGIGITALFGRGMVGRTIQEFSRIEIPLLSDIPFIGPLFNQDILVYFSIFIVLMVRFFFYKTKWGLYLRSVGENPAAADTSGISVVKYRMMAVLIGSGIAGLGGAYLSLAYTPFWVENMTAGRGWIAVALVIFSQWHATRAVFGAYLFGGVDALQLRMQAMGTEISTHILAVMPYLFTIVVLVISTIRLGKGATPEPESLGVPYDREDRK
ncbi:ABC transporter permease [Limisalsivibrio acetivorans]|uniref:ABC transporter permease n=1 Tax=Limisalsivibrio acetivorans TaxID=1304888 RepID=UPI0003B5C67F|nr:ABC transporter permease [Limisalsivibrio acetivorans]